MRLLFLFLVCVTQSVAFAEGPCAPTPTAALHAFEEHTPNESLTGFRVVKLRTDLQLGVTWADLKRCDHPEWPGLSLATHISAPANFAPSTHTPAAPLVVRAGETVRAWREDNVARLEMPAITDEGGAVGDRIRLHGKQSNGEPVRYAFGLVRGPGNVEMER